MAGFNNVTDFYPQITGQLTVYPGPINQVTATVDNNVGTPHVDVQTEYTADGMNINFDFHDMGIPGTDLTVLQPLTEQQKANARQNINAQEVLTFDSAPTQGSQNPVTSGGVYAAEQAIASDVADIEAVIPAAATSQNQLADKEYVDDSINRSSAFFRGNFETRAALMEVPWQTTDPDAPNYVSNNDYAYVADDETHDDESWRYIYVLEEGGSNNGWAAQYRVNESPLTTEQLAAINSGITSAGVAQIETNRTGLASHVADTSNPHQVTKAQVGLGNVDNTSDADKPISTAQQAALDALKDDIDSLYDPETASGDIVTIEDADPVLVDELVVDIQPVQDLHGQSAPYPNGGSKNKLGMILSNIKTINTSGTWSGNVYTNNGVSYEVLVDSANNVTGVKATGTASASSLIDLGDIIGISNGTSAILNGCPSGGSSSTYYLKFRNANIIDTGSGRTFTVDGNNSLVAFVTNGTTANFTFYPMVRLATESDPTFAPYSNICPISGWTGANITVAGKNLFPYAKINGYTYSWYQYYDFAHAVNPVFLKGGVTYTFSGVRDAQYSNWYPMFRFFKPNGTIIDDPNFATVSMSGITSWTWSGTPTCYKYAGGGAESTDLYWNVTPSEDCYIDQAIQSGRGDATSVQCEVGSTVTAYTAYNGSQIDVSWQDEAGTVYGGTLTYLGGGKYSLQATHTGVDMGSVAWSLDSYGNFVTSAFSNIKLLEGNVLPDDLCEVLQIVKFNERGNYTNPILCQQINNQQVQVRNCSSLYPDAATFITAMNGQTLVYELATLPDPIILDAEDIELLEGTNNIFADAGPVTVKFAKGTLAIALSKLTARVNALEAQA